MTKQPCHVVQTAVIKATSLFPVAAPSYKHCQSSYNTAKTVLALLKPLPEVAEAQISLQLSTGRHGQDPSLPLQTSAPIQGHA